MKKYIGELIGTFALVFCGTGAIVIDEVTNGKVSHVGVAITFGLIVMAMIYTFGDKTGAHINPAVTIAFAIKGAFPVRQVAPYIIGQLIGALLASVVLKLLFPTNVLLGATIPSGSNLQSLILEFILSFFLMLTIIHVAEGGKEKGLFAGLAIGSVVLLEAMFAGPISGASMNPARSIAPALVSGEMKQLWIYILAPISGTASAVGVSQLIK
jgi:aquaporin Z